MTILTNLFRVLLLLCCPLVLAAQTSEPAPTYIYIDDIKIEGNRKTKNARILRELDLAPGDSVLMSALGAALSRNRLFLMNTGLFSEAKINVRNWQEGNCVELLLVLDEAWYLFPFPVFSLADRNFNVWWHEFDRDLRRVNYGIDFYHFNLTGQGDQAKAAVQLGYAQRAEFIYDRPGINKKQTMGIRASFLRSRQRETFYKTADDKLLFLFTPNEFITRRTVGSAALTWRPGLFTWHTLTLERHENQVADSVTRELNPDFFLHGDTRQKHWSLIYKFLRDRRDIRPYPLRGWLGLAELRVNGLVPSDNLRVGRLLVEGNKYFSFSEKLSLETILVGRTSFPRRKIPYFNNQALGYGGNYVRGYEYYVADGLDFALLKTGLHFQIFDRAVNLGKWMPLKAYKIFPIKVYFAVNNDFGYANDPHYAANNSLSNRLLSGHGIGLDFVGYYTRVVQIEWSRNDRGESGFYVNIKMGF